MKVVMTIDELPDEQEIALTKKELEEYCKHKAADCLIRFIEQCNELAKDNLCPTYVTELNKITNAVLNKQPYAEASDKYILDELQQEYQ